MATPSPRAARSAMASAALACSAITGWRSCAAQAWSNTVRRPVPGGMHTIGWAVRSRRVTRRGRARGCPGGTAATSRSLMIVSASSPSGVGGRGPDEGQVDGAVADPLDEPVGVVLQQRDLHARVGLVERGEGVEQRGDGAADDHADGEPAADQAGHLAHRLADRRGGGERGAGVFERGLSRDGEGDGARRPVEQLGTELPFQLADLGADAGLADVHALGGPGEVPLLGDRDEVLQLPQFHDWRF